MYSHLLGKEASRQLNNTQKNKEEQLAELSYLWTSGEWTLAWVHHSRARLVLVFPAGRPSLQELLATRAVVPGLRNIPISVLKAELGTASEFIVGEFGGMEARRLQMAALKRGLQTRLEDTSYTGYLPLSAQGSVLIIEDDELSRRVSDEMLLRGIPVVSHTESD